MVTEVPVRIKLRGNIWRAYNETAREILLEGPARTGKTFGYLLRMVKHAQEIPGYYGLIVRKTAATLGNTVLRTLEKEVFHQWSDADRRSQLDHVHFFGGSKNEPTSYEFDNGSRIVVGGMDQATKILGSEYDEIFANEIIEFSLEDVETLLTRLSHGLTAPCLMSDCNPTYERHWVLQRAIRGQMLRLRTTLKDNPAFYTDDGELTQRGIDYLETIEGVTGTRYQRLVLGEWVGMENAIYPQLDAAKMLQPIPETTRWTGRGATGVDFGRVHLSAVVSVTQATDGVYWVRECWAENGGNLQAIEDACRAQRVRFGVRMGVTDPIQEVLAQRLGFKVAKSGAGARKGRISAVTKLLDAGALKFDANGAGVPELFEEMAMYRYETRETDTVIEDVVVRKDDDRVAGFEYAIEAIEREQRFEALTRRDERPKPKGVTIGAVR